MSWDEWFENFDTYGLTFVYEEEVADRAYEYFQARGGEHGRDREDWWRPSGSCRSRQHPARATG